MTVAAVLLVGVAILVQGWALRPRRASRPARRRGRSPVVERVAWVLLGALLAGVVLAVTDRDEQLPRSEAEAHEDVLDIGATEPFDSSRSPALAGADWVAGAQDDFFNVVATGLTYTPYVASSLRDYESEHVNVRQRTRLSYQPELPPGREPVDIWFFGASTLFGFTGQRDEHTIPSEVARLAEADGLPVRVRNYGSPGYVNFQEVVLLLQLLLAGERPDVVVFYDGINDVALQVQAAYGHLGRVGQLGDLGAAMLRRAFASQLTGSYQPPSPLGEPTRVGRPPRPDAVADAVIDTYEKGLELTRLLADTYGFTATAFWQADLFTKEPLDPGERSLVDAVGFDTRRFRSFQSLVRSVVDRLPPTVVDLSGALDGSDGPVLLDQAHTNEQGARLVAEAMFGHLRPTIERAARR